MKKKSLIIIFILLLLLFQDISCQDSLKAMITGTWYRSDNTPFQFSDTLILQKDFKGQTFNMWEFDYNKSLKISSGTIRENNKNAKCFNKLIHYKWELISSTDNTSIIQVSFGKTILLFTIYSVQRKKIVLVKHSEPI